MKRKFLLLIICCSVFFASDTFAQQSPLQAYWNIEDNVNVKKQYTVYFYSAAHELMYKENIAGRKLKVGNNKTVRQLNAALDEVLLAWRIEKRIQENQQIIAKRL